MNSPGRYSMAARPQGTLWTGGCLDLAAWCWSRGCFVGLVFFAIFIPHLIVGFVQVQDRILQIDHGRIYRLVPQYLLELLYGHSLLNGADAKAGGKVVRM